MEISIEELILLGETKSIMLGLSLDDVKKKLGEPEGVSTFKKPLILLYDNIEFSFTYKVLTRIGIDIHKQFNVPSHKQISIVDYSFFANLTIESCKEFLLSRNIEFITDENYVDFDQYAIEIIRTDKDVYQNKMYNDLHVNFHFDMLTDSLTTIQFHSNYKE